MSGYGGMPNNSGRRPPRDTVQTLQRPLAGRPTGPTPENPEDLFWTDSKPQRSPNWRELTQTTHGTPEGHSVNLDELRDRDGNLIEGSGFIKCFGSTDRLGDFETARDLLEKLDKGKGTPEYDQAVEELGRLCAPRTPVSLAPPSPGGRNHG